jgi:hypothetical protein
VPAGSPLKISRIWKRINVGWTKVPLPSSLLKSTLPRKTTSAEANEQSITPPSQLHGKAEDNPAKPVRSAVSSRRTYLQNPFGSFWFPGSKSPNPNARLERGLRTGTRRDLPRYADHTQQSWWPEADLPGLISVKGVVTPNPGNFTSCSISICCVTFDPSPSCQKSLNRSGAKSV